MKPNKKNLKVAENFSNWLDKLDLEQALPILSGLLLQYCNQYEDREGVRDEIISIMEQVEFVEREAA